MIINLYFYEQAVNKKRRNFFTGVLKGWAAVASAMMVLKINQDKFP